MHHASASILHKIEQFEGFIPRARNIGDGVLTIGFGETQGVHAGDTITVAAARARLKRRVRRDYEPYVRALGIPFSQNEFDALVSAIYNLGPGILDRGRSLGDALRDRPHKDGYAKRVGDALLLYSMPGSIFHEGLLKRREAEAKLFATPDAPTVNKKAVRARRHKLQARVAKIRLNITNEKKRIARINRTINRLNKRLEG